MPDENKFRALRTAGFRIVPTCASCAYFNRTDDRSRGDPLAWGTCRLVRYEHAKHSGSIREASVRADGQCHSHAATSRAAEDLRASGFTEFRT